MKKCMPLDIISVTNSMYYTNANSFYESTITNNHKKKNSLHTGISLLKILNYKTKIYYPLFHFQVEFHRN